MRYSIEFCRNEIFCRDGKNRKKVARIKIFKLIQYLYIITSVFIEIYIKRILQKFLQIIYWINNNPEISELYIKIHLRSIWKPMFVEISILIRFIRGPVMNFTEKRAICNYQNENRAYPWKQNTRNYIFKCISRDVLFRAFQLQLNEYVTYFIPLTIFEFLTLLFPTIKQVIISSVCLVSMVFIDLKMFEILKINKRKSLPWFVKWFCALNSWNNFLSPRVLMKICNNNIDR